MRFKRMELEVWFDKFQYAIDYDIGESADTEEVEIGLSNLDKALDDLAS